MVYRFKVTYEEHEDVFRYIEIKSSQSFLELHTAIQQSIGFDNSKSATFYTSDDYWRKEDEISVENTSNEKIKKVKNKKTEEPKKKKNIADHIENPHQRFIYVFDPEKEWTFLLELLKIIPPDNAVVYPQCVKSIGTSPKQYKPTNLPPPVDEEGDDHPKVPSSDPEEKEDPAPIVLEKNPLDSEPDGFIPLDEDGGKELNDEDAKVSDEDSEEPSAEDENAESSEGFEFDDKD
ncbi:MAG: hypothetical protein EPN85_14885 [Bacteroidetes bacterium]|nr:MAG: hypothetical protein EPN85_14885 [Bacteroidota bacterium]